MGKQSFSSDDGMIQLVGMLLEGQTLTAKIIAGELGIKHAAARRKLRALQGLPRAVSAHVGRDAAVKLPMLLQLPTVTPADAAAACLASSFGSALRETPLGSRLRKLVDGLVARSQTYCNAKDLDRKFWFVVRGGERALPRRTAMLDQVLEAILASKSLRFRYCHFNGEAEAVTASPLTLAVYDHQFYVICRKETAPVFYPFRFARMSRLEVRGAFPYPSESEYDPVAVFRESFGIFIGIESQPVDVCIRLDAGWKNYIESHRWHESQRSSTNADGSVDLVIHVRVCPEVRRWIQWFGPDAVVIKPAWLRERIAVDLRKAAKRYRPAAGTKIRSSPTGPTPKSEGWVRAGQGRSKPKPTRSRS